MHQHEGLEWTEGVGLDPASPEYQAYLKEFGETYLRVVGDSIDRAGRIKKQRALDPLANEVLAHAQMCHRKSTTFVGREQALFRLAEFATGGEQQSQVFILYGQVQGSFVFAWAMFSLPLALRCEHACWFSWS